MTLRYSKQFNFTRVITLQFSIFEILNYHFQNICLNELFRCRNKRIFNVKNEYQDDDNSKVVSYVLLDNVFLHFEWLVNNFFSWNISLFLPKFFFISQIKKETFSFFSELMSIHFQNVFQKLFNWKPYWFFDVNLTFQKFKKK